MDVAKAYARFSTARLPVGLKAKDGSYLAREVYEMGEGPRVETLEQRYNRLRQEFEEFQVQVEAAKTAAAPEGGDAATAVAIAEQVKFMQDQLQQVNLDQVLGGDSVTSDDVPGMQAELTKRLMSEIGKFKASEASSAGESDPKSDTITYELNYRPEHARYQQEAKIGAVEARLHTVEKYVGSSSLESIANFLDVPNLTLKSAVEALAKRVDAMSEENLADLDRRLQNVIKAIDEAKKKKAAATEDASETAAKVTELHETCKRWDEVAASVPEVVDRLHTLRSLHEQGAQFGKSMTHIDTVQQQLRDQLATQTVTLNTVEESFKKNLTTIEANFASIDKRISALSSKLS